jgi:tetratricopeptide (TPR) repeat protein
MTDGSAVLVELVQPSRPLVVVSPCRAVMPVSGSVRTVVVAHPGDRSILTRPAALESLADCIVRSAPPQQKYEWALFRRYRLRALQVVAHSVGVTPAALDRAIRRWGRTVNDAFSQGLVALYEQRARDAAARLRNAIRDDMTLERNKVAQTQFYLARALYAQRQLAQSAAAYERSAAIWPNDVAVLTSWGWALWELYDFNGAELLLRRALSAEEDLVGPHAQSVGILALYLAGVLYTKPDYAEIESLNRRALTIAEKLTGSNSAEYAEALHQSGVLAVARLDSPSGKTHFQRALSIRQRTLGPGDRETAETLDELGTLLYRQRNSCNDAFPLFRKALAIREKVFGARHPATARSANAMALCFEETGVLDKAEEY